MAAARIWTFDESEDILISKGSARVVIGTVVGRIVVVSFVPRGKCFFVKLSTCN